MSQWHYFVFMGVDRGVTNGASETCSWSSRSDISRCRRILASQTKIQHENSTACVLYTTHSEVGLNKMWCGEAICQSIQLEIIYDKYIWWVGQSIKLTGLISRWRKPTSWILSMALSICKPSRRLVDKEKAPLGWARRNSARFLPCSCITT